jgi:cobalamin biosynthesis protein CobT
MDSAVLLLVDCSGSMSGGKIATAASAAAQLTEVLKCVSVPVAVLGFTDMAGCQVFTFKDFRESVTPDVLLGRFAWVLPSMCGNSDADALLFANRYLIDNITATRKVLIVLSDGCPTDCYIPPEGLSGASAARMAHNGLKSVTTEIQDAFITGKSNVELLGIGIKDDSVRNYYRRCVVIERNSELEGTLLGVVKSAIV